MALGSTLATETKRAPREVSPRAMWQKQQHQKMRGTRKITPRQFEVWDLIAQGKSYKECAVIMGLGSEEVVKTYAYELGSRLGVGGRNGLIAEWWRRRAELWLARHGSALPLEALQEFGEVFGVANNSDRWLN